MTKVLWVGLISLGWAASVAAQNRASIGAGPADGRAAWQLLNEQFSKANTEAVVPAQHADAAREFYRNYPHDKNAGNAHKLEILALLGAPRTGDQLQVGRLRMAVNAMRTDPDVSEADKAEVSGYLYFGEAMAQVKERKDVPRVLEPAARKMMAEFPAQPQGYETLLTVSQLSDDQRAIPILEELVVSNAPLFVKRGASCQLNRRRVVGGWSWTEDVAREG